MTNEKKDYRYVKMILKNYKWNKSRIRIIKLNMLDDSDMDLRGIDYSRVVVQTSNTSSLDDAIIARDLELKKLEKQVLEVDILLDSLDSRKDQQKRKLIEAYYIENMTQRETMQETGLYDNRHFFKLCNKILEELAELL